MPLDHYVPQVYLKNFYSPALGNRMYALRKSDLKAFTPDSKSVCRIPNGSTNFYLRSDRQIEEFLRTIEPKYNSAVAKLTANTIDKECIYTIAGFVAYVVTCSPTAMRINSMPLRSIVESAAATADAKGLLPKLPAALGSKNLAELLQTGAVQVTIDPKYPQALGIAAIRDHIVSFGNYRWEVLINNFSDSPFFTSEFPAAIEETADRRILNRIVPLTPYIAIRIFPDITLDRTRANFEFSQFTHCARKVNRAEVMQINRIIVKCAEDAVFYRDEHTWVRAFIEKNRSFRIEPILLTRRTSNGTQQVTTLRIVPVKQPVK